MENFESVFLVIQLIVAIAIVALVLLQRSEGGALGIGGGPTGMMSARGAANLLTRVTKWLAVVFIVNSLILANISANRNKGDNAVDIAAQQNTLPQKEKADEQPALPSKNDGDEKDN